jgi:hypothetical protein
LPADRKTRLSKSIRIGDAIAPDIALIILSRRYPIRRASTWHGGLSPDPARATAVTSTSSEVSI